MVHPGPELIKGPEIVVLFDRRDTGRRVHRNVHNAAFMKIDGFENPNGRAAPGLVPGIPDTVADRTTHGFVGQEPFLDGLASLLSERARVPRRLDLEPDRVLRGRDRKRDRYR